MLAPQREISVYGAFTETVVSAGLALHHLQWGI